MATAGRAWVAAVEMALGGSEESVGTVGSVAEVASVATGRGNCRRLR